MFGVVVLTFVITILSMTLFFMLHEINRQREDNRNILEENDGLKRRISDYRDREFQRRERHAYDQGLYDGRATDTLYRNVLKRYSAQEQARVAMDGEEEK